MDRHTGKQTDTPEINKQGIKHCLQGYGKTSKFFLLFKHMLSKLRVKVATWFDNGSLYSYLNLLF